MDALGELIEQVTRYHPEADVGLLRLAAAVAQPVVLPCRVSRAALAASARVCRSISCIHVLHMLSVQRVSHTRSV
jgi:hypothetical protein